MQPLKKTLKIKLIIIYITIYLFFNPILHFVSETNNHLINDYNIYSQIFLRFKERPLNFKISLISEEKKNIDIFSSSDIKRNISSVKRIVYSGDIQFGNILLIINKLIFVCEIIGCNEIDLEGPSFWFIKNNISLNYNNITINKIDEQYDLNHYNDSETIYYTSWNIYYYLPKIKPKIRIHLLKNEILKNLPKSNISKNHLYIHIRSGDIFSTVIHKPYAQPPLCFYKSILYNFNFSSIYLISQNRNNPIINKLIAQYKNIIFEFPNHFTIFRMEPSANYKNNMRIWKNNRKQRILMIKEKCINPFTMMKI